MIVCFEGINGAGKSTQIGLFCRHLQGKGRPYVVLHDPGIWEGHPCQELRKLFVYGDRWKNSKTTLLIGAAARAELTYEIREAAKDPQMTVILDRYESSTYVYQTLMMEDAGIAQDRAVALVSSLGAIIDCVCPHQLIFLDPPFATAFDRRGGGRRHTDEKRDDQFEARGLAFASRLRSRYLWAMEYAISLKLCVRHPSIIAYGADTPPEQVFQRCLTELTAN